jgi:Multicopper oxidase
MIQVPYWDGNPNHPYPSVTVLIDFRGNDIGDFVFHCHILNHEDLGMMNIHQSAIRTGRNQQRWTNARIEGPPALGSKDISGSVRRSLAKGFGDRR